MQKVLTSRIKFGIEQSMSSIRMSETESLFPDQIALHVGQSQSRSSPVLDLAMTGASGRNKA